ncbi:hypothetical protein C1H46_026799 [Malus baccata]|uniref:Uncharacterized protein n=1 Tax=Malus baccata TaxID=106549 RepID=A0A540LM97_MALBA|nr:hypothetical protein C1H46_026799 [Malus baccata]
MFIGVKKRDPGTLKGKSETGVKNHKPVVEVPSVPATTPTTTSTTSETWDM